jgi:pyruvate kinase
MMRAGVDIARLNFSHGAHKSHAELIKNIRAASRSAKKKVSILQDLSGPRIQNGKIEVKNITTYGNLIPLLRNEVFCITSR